MDGAAVNPHLLKERRTSTFDVETLTNILDGGKERTRRRREIQSLAFNDRVFSEEPPTCFLSRDEMYDRAVKRAVRVHEISDQMDLSESDMHWLHSVAYPLVAPLSDLQRMVIGTVLNQATDTQKKMWLPKIKTHQYIGTYSQTELGHGTHVRNLETTATYDVTTDEFVLHSPTITSTKWWSGGQGKTANCSVVLAQLIISGISYGTFPFFVVFRDLETHQPLPEITVGDIGPKMGFNIVDNGFLRFEHFRIPRVNMLMKHVEVLKDGTFLRNTKQQKPTYLPMTEMRISIIHVHCYDALATAMTIAVRYSAVRRQSELEPGAPEPQILDYQTQQYKLLPYLATTYAYKFAAERLMTLTHEAANKLQNDDDSMMPELHALSSGLKAYCTSTGLLIVEQSRMACGGHGYSEASGFPKLYTLLAAYATAEGEITVLLLQLARYLLKCADQITGGQPLDKSAAYIAAKDNTSSSIDDTFNMRDLIKAFEHRARRVIIHAANSVKREVSEGRPAHEAKNRCAVYLVRAAIAHCETYIVANFAAAIDGIPDTAIAQVLTQLCQLFAVYRIVNQSGEFIEDGFMSEQQLKLVKAKEISLLADIRPNAVALVDAFDLPDGSHNSVLGRYDGQVYENLYKWALDSPLNNSEVHDSYYKYLQPMMKARI